MRLTTAIVATIATTAAAQAQFSLQISEIWPGNEPGSNLTQDWFEITNTGTSDFVFGADGFLFYDDDSQDPTTADILNGVGTIGAGESAVFVNSLSTGNFISVWGLGMSSVQVGTFAGSGLGQGGDGVTLFLGATNDFTALTASDIIDYQAYPDANLTGGQSWDVVLGAFSTVGNASGAFATTIANDEGQFGIGSPGSVVPAPAALAVLGLGGFAATRRRR